MKDGKMVEERWKDSVHSIAGPPAYDSGVRRKTSLNKNTNISIKGQNNQTSKLFQSHTRSNLLNILRENKWKSIGL